MASGSGAIVRGRTDAAARLVEADKALVGLQRACGGAVPGLLAIPALLELVRASLRAGRSLARPIRARDGAHAIAAHAEAAPRPDGCLLVLRDWRAVPLPKRPRGMDDERALLALIADLELCVDAGGVVLTASGAAKGLADVAAALRASPGCRWTEVFQAADGRGPLAPGDPLTDGAEVRVAGRAEQWQARQLARLDGALGADLFLVPRSPTSLPMVQGVTVAGALVPPAIGRELASVLRIATERILARAESVIGGADETPSDYTAYCGDIAQAARHLLGLLDSVDASAGSEAAEFTVAVRRIDLAEIARQVADMLAAQSRQTGMRIEVPVQDTAVPAIGDPARVLQIALNLVGNALRYSSGTSAVWLATAVRGTRAVLTVSDQGPGLNPEQQERAFAKFERLGRSNSGGSGLGLYISRNLARAMSGELTVASVPGEGATFTLTLPAAA